MWSIWVDRLRPLWQGEVNSGLFDCVDWRIVGSELAPAINKGRKSMWEISCDKAEGQEFKLEDREFKTYDG